MYYTPQFDPIAFSIGPLHVHWYGLMYVVAFVLVLVLGRIRIRQGLAPIDARGLDDLLFYGMLGTILGGRLGFVLFYRPGYYFSDPIQIFKVWEGGMSFHGGMIGVILGMWWFARKVGAPFWRVTDFVAPLVPLGLAAGRLGNFINGELWGRPTTVSWAMIFPKAPDRLPRHPSELYEFALEGILLFLVLWIFSRKPRPVGSVSGLFLVGYGIVRFCVEFTRQPDEGLEHLPLGLSMGQWLSWPMVVLGLIILVWAHRRYAAREIAIEAIRSENRSP